MSSSIDLGQSYLIDTVEVIPDDGNRCTFCLHEAELRMKTYRVIAQSATQAMEKFTNGEGQVVFEGEPAEFVIIGIEKENHG